jgi:hypothetical protein
MWLDKMIQPQGDPWLLRWDLGKTDFMEPDLPPAFLYYNPWPKEKRVKVLMAKKEDRVHDMMLKKSLQTHAGAAELTLRPFEAKVVEIRG